MQHLLSEHLTRSSRDSNPLLWRCYSLPLPISLKSQQLNHESCQRAIFYSAWITLSLPSAQMSVRRRILATALLWILYLRELPAIDELTYLQDAELRVTLHCLLRLLCGFYPPVHSPFRIEGKQVANLKPPTLHLAISPSLEHCLQLPIVR